MQTNNFDLAACVAGTPCRTRSGRKATFLFMTKGKNETPTPVVMLIGERMENFTKEGKHIFDSELDLRVDDPIDWNIPPTDYPAASEALKKFMERDCLNVS